MKRSWMMILAAAIAMCMFVMSCGTKPEQDGKTKEPSAQTGDSVSEEETTPSATAPKTEEPTTPAPTREPEYTGEIADFTGAYLAHIDQKYLWDSPVIIRADKTCLVEGTEYKWTAKSAEELVLWNGEQEAGLLYAQNYEGDSGKLVSEVNIKLIGGQSNNYERTLIPWDYEGKFLFAGTNEECPETIEFTEGWKMKYGGETYYANGRCGYYGDLLNFYDTEDQCIFSISLTNSKAVPNLLEKGLLTLWRTDNTAGGIYVREDMYDVIELTPENYEEYFECREPEPKVEAVKDAFGDVNECKFAFNYYAPKKEGAIYHYLTRVKFATDPVRIYLDKESGNVSLEHINPEIRNDPLTTDIIEAGTAYSYPYLVANGGSFNWITGYSLPLSEEGGRLQAVTNDYHLLEIDRLMGHICLPKGDS